MKLPKSVTIAGLVLALAAIFVDPSSQSWLTTLLGEQAATKLAAIGALLSALGRAVLAPTPSSDAAPADTLTP